MKPLQVMWELQPRVTCQNKVTSNQAQIAVSLNLLYQETKKKRKLSVRCSNLQTHQFLCSALSFIEHMCMRRCVFSDWCVCVNASLRPCAHTEQR